MSATGVFSTVGDTAVSWTTSDNTPLGDVDKYSQLVAGSLSLAAMSGNPIIGSQALATNYVVAHTQLALLITAVSSNAPNKDILSASLGVVGAATSAVGATAELAGEKKLAKIMEALGGVITMVSLDMAAPQMIDYVKTQICTLLANNDAQFVSSTPACGLAWNASLTGLSDSLNYLDAYINSNGNPSLSQSQAAVSACSQLLSDLSNLFGASGTSPLSVTSTATINENFLSLTTESGNSSSVTTTVFQDAEGYFGALQNYYDDGSGLVFANGNFVNYAADSLADISIDSSGNVTTTLTPTSGPVGSVEQTASGDITMTDVSGATINAVNDASVGLDGCSNITVNVSTGTISVSADTTATICGTDNIINSASGSSVAASGVCTVNGSSTTISLLDGATVTIHGANNAITGGVCSKAIVNNTDGTSQVTFFSPTDYKTKEIQNFLGLNGTGANTENFIYLSNGTTLKQVFSPSQNGLGAIGTEYTLGAGNQWINPVTTFLAPTAATEAADITYLQDFKSSVNTIIGLDAPSVPRKTLYM